MTDEVVPLTTLDEARQSADSWTLVWIDARQALLARWSEGQTSLTQLESDVPRHHRSTGHVRHADTGRTHAGPPRSAGETHRLEHLRRFVEQVRARLPAADELVIVGPGSVAVQLARAVHDHDHRHGRQRQVVHRRAPVMTDRQLLADVRQLAGDKPPRRTVGAYRWSGRQPLTSRGNARPPRRVISKPLQPRSAMESLEQAEPEEGR